MKNLKQCLIFLFAFCISVNSYAKSYKIFLNCAEEKTSLSDFQYYSDNNYYDEIELATWYCICNRLIKTYTKFALETNSHLTKMLVEYEDLNSYKFRSMEALNKEYRTNINNATFNAEHIMYILSMKYMHKDAPLCNSDGEPTLLR